MHRIKIFACDSNTVDENLSVKRYSQEEIAAAQEPLRSQYIQTNELLDHLDITTAAKGTTRGQKYPSSRDDHLILAEKVKGLPADPKIPGGSSANTLVTLSKLLGDNVQIDFLSAIGHDENGTLIRKSLEEANIRLHPEKFPDGVVPESAHSYIFNEREPEPNGQRTLAAYPGNIGKVLTPDLVPKNLLDECDIAFIQGALWNKMGRSTPDHLMSVRKNKKPPEVWLTLPTQAKFSDVMPQTEYRKLIPGADVILTNHKELINVMETRPHEEESQEEKKQLTPEDLTLRAMREEGYLKDAIREMQRQMQVKYWKDRSEPMAFVTREEKGAIIVTRDNECVIPAEYLDKNTPNYFTGAGDTAYAGFLAGRMAKMSLEDSGKLAMILAAAKSKIVSPRLPDPIHTLETYSDESRELLAKLQAGIARRVSRPETQMAK